LILFMFSHKVFCLNKNRRNMAIGILPDSKDVAHILVAHHGLDPLKLAEITVRVRKLKAKIQEACNRLDQLERGSPFTARPILPSDAEKKGRLAERIAALSAELKDLNRKVSEAESVKEKAALAFSQATLDLKGATRQKKVALNAKKLPLQQEASRTQSVHAALVKEKDLKENELSRAQGRYQALNDSIEQESARVKEAALKEEVEKVSRTMNEVKFVLQADMNQFLQTSVPRYDAETARLAIFYLSQLVPLA
jgi:chromosome segregation ATPase